MELRLLTKLLAAVVIAPCLADFQPEMIANATIQASYQRIRIAERSDIDRLYSLISAYIAKPRLAETVTEIVIKPLPMPRESCWGFDDSTIAIEPMEPVRNEAYIAIESYVKDMGLGDETTREMMKSLEWQRSHMLGAWSGSSHEQGQNRRNFSLAATTILLSLCKNIEKLYIGEINPSWGTDEPLSGYLLKSNYAQIPNPGLQKLREVELANDGFPPYGSSWFDERVYSRVEFMDYMQYFHRLPSIHSITMDAVGEYQAEREFFPERCGNFKKIHITHSDISSSMFDQIIAISKDLEDVKLSIGGLWSQDGGSPLFALATIGERLSEHRSTLKRLDLDVDGNSEEDTPEDMYGDYWEEELEGLQKLFEEFYGHDYLALDKEAAAPPSVSDASKRTYGRTIGSLHDFEALTHLSIRLKGLLGPPFGERWSHTRIPEHEQKPPFRLVDGLPPNLEYLCIYDYERGAHSDFDGYINELLAEKAERYPKLKEILGIDEFVPSLESQFWDRKEDSLYQRPERNDLGWKEA